MLRDGTMDREEALSVAVLIYGPPQIMALTL
jgi:hypothetical protein